MSTLNDYRNIERVAGGPNVMNMTDGLITLCEEWIKPDFVMAEVGCCRGISTAVFSFFAKTVHAIDPWTDCIAEGYADLPIEFLEAAEREFDMMAADRENIVKHRGFSIDEAPNFKGLDAVYIDGDHSAKHINQDFDAWLPALKPGGLLMGHDNYLVNEILLRRKWLPTKVYEDTSWVIEGLA